jgi:5-methylcytosine-specific restriction endonuclease McrA
MPWAPPRVCLTHGEKIPRGGRCGACGRTYDRGRPEHFAFYTSAAWRLLRAQVLREVPWCQCPERCGRRSVDVDHIVPRSERPDLELVRMNLRALSRKCHGRITRRARDG